MLITPLHTGFVHSSCMNSVRLLLSIIRLAPRAPMRFTHPCPGLSFAHRTRPSSSLFSSSRSSIPSIHCIHITPSHPPHAYLHRCNTIYRRHFRAQTHLVHTIMTPRFSPHPLLSHSLSPSHPLCSVVGCMIVGWSSSGIVACYCSYRAYIIFWSEFAVIRVGCARKARLYGLLLTAMFNK